MLLGSMLAWFDSHGTRKEGSPRNPRASFSWLGRTLNWKDAAAALALALLATGFITINSDSMFPGWWVLLPTVASFLLIWSGETAWTNARILSHPSVVFVGLISYPLYLWYWPLLSFLRILEGKPPSPGTAAIAVMAAVGLAVLTWLFIERPLRTSRRIRAKSVAILSIAMAAIASLAILSFSRIVQTPKMAKEASEDQKVLMRASRDCRGLLSERSPAYPGCRVFGDPTAARTFVVWGDSYAGMWEAPIEAVARKRGARLVQFMYFGCPPLLGVRRVSGPAGSACSDSALASTVLRSISGLKPSLTILTGRWSAYVEPDLGSGVLISARPNGGFDKQTAQAALKARLPETVRGLARLGKVLVIKGVPSLHLPTNAGLARDPQGFEPSRAEHDALEASPNAVIDGAAHDTPGVITLDPAEVLCDPTKCHAILHGVRAYLPQDSSHLSDQGALLFLPRFESLVK